MRGFGGSFFGSSDYVSVGIAVYSKIKMIGKQKETQRWSLFTHLNFKRPKLTSSKRRGYTLKDVFESDPTFPPTLTEKAAVWRFDRIYLKKRSWLGT